ncbi:MAG: hypothetical protein JWN14_3840 [Chthonomonadales bacterium]|nr:hypothetical protein [Chthonomonadales bacterium]
MSVSVVAPSASEMLPGQIFVAHADLTQLSADAVVLSTSTSQEWVGMMSGGFDQAFGVAALWESAKEGGAQLTEIGDVWWLALETEAKPKGIVLSVCTGPASTLTRKQLRSLPVKAAIREAFTHLRALGATHRLLIGLPLMRLGKGGDSRAPLESVRDQIAAARTALDELAQSDLWQAGADVVFAAFTYDHYQVTLEARRLENQRPLLQTILPPNFDLLVRSLRNDESVLFVGAGLSAGTGFTTYHELISRMAQRLGEDPNFRQIHAKIAHTLREAKQPAFTLVFESLSEPARKQWNKQQVFPICIAGNTKEEKLFHLACLLDHVAEKVAGDSHLYLSHKPRADKQIETSALQQRLRELGTLLESEIADTLSDEQARRLAVVLIFLTDQGWRPRRVSLSTLWERLPTPRTLPNTVTTA